jgi:hypothetical protein
MTQSTAEGVFAAAFGLFMMIACKPMARFSVIFNESLGIKGVGERAYAVGYLVFGIIVIVLGLTQIGVM